MPKRYGKSFSHMLNVAARLNADFGRGTHFFLETSPQQTRLQKAIRQRVKLLSKTVYTLQDWDVYECQLPGRTERTRHIAGRVGWKQEFVVTPAITAINSETREAVAETGAIYVLGGHVQGGPGVDTKWAWWRDKQRATDVLRITMEVRDALLSKRKRPAPLMQQAEDLKTLLTDHGSEAYKALVRGAKIITHLLQYGPPSAVDMLQTQEQQNKDWLQSKDDNSFNDALGGTTRYKKESKK